MTQTRAVACNAMMRSEGPPPGTAYMSSLFSLQANSSANPQAGSREAGATAAALSEAEEDVRSVSKIELLEQQIEQLRRLLSAQQSGGGEASESASARSGGATNMVAAAHQHHHPSRPNMTAILEGAKDKQLRAVVSRSLESETTPAKGGAHAAAGTGLHSHLLTGLQRLKQAVHATNSRSSSGGGARTSPGSDDGSWSPVVSPSRIFPKDPPAPAAISHAAAFNRRASMRMTGAAAAIRKAASSAASQPRSNDNHTPSSHGSAGGATGPSTAQASALEAVGRSGHPRHAAVVSRRKSLLRHEVIVMNSGGGTPQSSSSSPSMYAVEASSTRVSPSSTTQAASQQQQQPQTDAVRPRQRSLSFIAVPLPQAMAPSGQVQSMAMPNAGDGGVAAAVAAAVRRRTSLENPSSASGAASSALTSAGEPTRLAAADAACAATATATPALATVKHPLAQKKARSRRDSTFSISSESSNGDDSEDEGQGRQRQRFPRMGAPAPSSSSAPALPLSTAGPAPVSRRHRRSVSFASAPPEVTYYDGQESGGDTDTTHGRSSNSSSGDGGAVDETLLTLQKQLREVAAIAAARRAAAASAPAGVPPSLSDHPLPLTQQAPGAPVVSARPPMSSFQADIRAAAAARALRSQRALEEGSTPKTSSSSTSGAPSRPPMTAGGDAQTSGPRGVSAAPMSLLSELQSFSATRLRKVSGSEAPKAEQQRDPRAPLTESGASNSSKGPFLSPKASGAGGMPQFNPAEALKGLRKVSRPAN